MNGGTGSPRCVATSPLFGGTLMMTTSPRIDGMNPELVNLELDLLKLPPLDDDASTKLNTDIDLGGRLDSTATFTTDRQCSIDTLPPSVSLLHQTPSTSGAADLSAAAAAAGAVACSTSGGVGGWFKSPKGLFVTVVVMGLASNMILEVFSNVSFVCRLARVGGGPWTGAQGGEPVRMPDTYVGPFCTPSAQHTHVPEYNTPTCTLVNNQLRHK